MTDTLLMKMNFLSEYTSLSDEEYSICLASDVIPELIAAKNEISENELIAAICLDRSTVSREQLKFEYTTLLVR